MPNIATVLKEEIKRLSRREIKKSTTTLKAKVAALSKSVVQQKRHVAELQKELSKLQKMTMADKPTPLAAKADEIKKARIGARSIRAQRRRLKLTQAQYAKLLGVSPPTILAWEKKKAEPRGENLAALIGVRKIKITEARQRLGLQPVKKKRKKKKRRKRKKK